MRVFILKTNNLNGKYKSIKIQTYIIKFKKWQKKSCIKNVSIIQKMAEKKVGLEKCVNNTKDGSKKKVALEKCVNNVSIIEQNKISV